jgi:hypothetical protein
MHISRIRVKYYLKQYCTVTHFSQYDISFNISVLNNFRYWFWGSSQWWGIIMWSALGQHRLVHIWLWMFWRIIRGVSSYAILMEAAGPGQTDWCPFRLHGSITDKATISNLSFMHFSCIASICYKKAYVHMPGNTSSIILHYTVIWVEIMSVVIL